MLKKIIFLFNFKEKIFLYSILILMTIGAILEIVSLASVIPFFSILLKQDNIILSNINSVLNFFNLDQFDRIYILGIFIIFLFTFKNLYMILLNYFSYRFLYKKYSSLSSSLFSKYLQMNFIDHLKKNTSILQRNINNDVFLLITNILIPLIIVISESLVVILVLVTLVVVEPLQTIIIGIILTILIIFFSKIFRNKVAYLGLVAQQNFGEMIKNVNQSLLSIKFIKISNSEKFFLNKYKKYLNTYSDHSSYIKNLSQLPRFITELIIIYLLIVISLIYFYNSDNFVKYIPTLSFFAMATIRLMPSFNRILSAMTNIRFHTASLDVVYNEFIFSNNKYEKNIKELNEINFRNKIILSDVQFSYNNNHKTKINLEIKKNQMVAFVGKSGAGKTTIIDLICGILVPDKGNIFVDEINIQENIVNWQNQIGYVPQNISLIEGNIRENILFSKNNKNFDRISYNNAINNSYLNNYIHSLNEKDLTQIGENGKQISGGEKQRIGIARALYNNPKVLILDEGTSSLDNEAQKSITKIIKQLSEKITVILIAHRLEILKECDRIFLIENGKVKNEYDKSYIQEQKNNLDILLND